MPRFAAGAPYLWPVPIYGYTRVSTDGQTLDARIAQLKAAGAEKVFREKVSRARADRPELARLMRALTSGDVVLVTRLDRLARSTRDLLNTLAALVRNRPAFGPCRMLGQIRRPRMAA
jgi:DNA invertase Pin-like site-specific DNA recombinase